MRAALYARYSSEGQREASIEDQNRNCARYAKREGWTIVEEYSDKALSGSTAQRPGYQQMLTDAKAKRFDVLLADDLSRLTRDEAELITTRKRLVFWGVRLVGVSDGFDTNLKGYKIQASFHGIKNEMYLDELAAKTYRGLEGQAKRGNNTGGRNFGYKHVPIEHPTEKDALGRPKILAVRRVIDEAQARVVRQIFEWYAGGQSPRQIVKTLNQRKVPSPGASYRRLNRSAIHGTWAASVLHGELRRATGILTNPIYIGRQIWNRREWVRNPETKHKLPRLRPESEWIVTEHPDLRIVPQPLWLKVQERRKAAAHGSHPTPRTHKYLLSGLLKCAECESNFVMQSYYQYGCAGHKDRGSSVCGNDLKVSRTLAEQKLLAGIRQDLFTPEGLSLFVKETSRLLAERSRQRQPERDRAHHRLNEVEGEIANIMKAIKVGVVTVTTKTALMSAESERTRLQQTMTASEDTVDKVVTLLPRAKERYRNLIEGIGALSTTHLPQAREQVRALVGEIRLTPTKAGYLMATLTGRYAGLLNLLSGGKLNYEGCGGGI